jgi:hypothetical protein
MISLSDRQLDVVMAAARAAPHEKRAQFLKRIAAMLKLRGRGHFDDADVTDAVSRALNGMTHQPGSLIPKDMRSGDLLPMRFPAAISGKQNTDFSWLNYCFY